MRIDWLTATIWFIGFAVFIIWIVFPLREFIKLMKEKMEKGSFMN
jgi:hypothetical protein